LPPGRSAWWPLAPLPSRPDFFGGIGENGQRIGSDAAGSNISRAPDPLEQMALVMLRDEYVALFWQCPVKWCRNWRPPASS